MGDLDDVFTLSTDTEADGAVVLVLTGTLDHQSAPAVRLAVTHAAEVASRLVFDLSQVDFIDSSGLAALLAAAELGPVALRRPSNATTRLLDVTGLSGYFVVEP